MPSRRDHLLIGLGLGIAFPIAAYGILLTLYDFLDAQGLLDSTGFSANFRSRTLALVAICINVLVIQYFMKRHSTRSMRGVLLSTFALAVFWIIYFKVITW